MKFREFSHKVYPGLQFQKQSRKNTFIHDTFLRTFPLQKNKHMLIDTHTHLFLKEFDEDRDEMMKRTLENGVKKVYLPNIDSSTTSQMLQMEEDYDWAKPMIGLHPCSVENNVQKELAHIEAYLKKHKFAAIGEIGLDFYWDTTYKEQQIEVFKKEIDLALAYDLPIVIHARNSLDECIEIVQAKQNGHLKGIFHCFSGTLEQANKIIDLDFLMGIGGIVTFKNANLPKIIKDINIKYLVLETDSPYLAPTPHRGKRNESSYIPLIAEKIAEVQGISMGEVAAVTSENAQQLYKL